MFLPNMKLIPKRHKNFTDNLPEKAKMVGENSKCLVYL